MDTMSDMKEKCVTKMWMLKYSNVTKSIIRYTFGNIAFEF